MKERFIYTGISAKQYMQNILRPLNFKGIIMINEEVLDLCAEIKEIGQIQKDLNLSLEAASDVWYLRTRHRHTPELEQALIEAHAKGEAVNIMEFGCTPDTGRAVLQAALDNAAGKRILD